MLDAVVDCMAGYAVRLAEGHALFHEVIGEVRGVGEVFADCFEHDVAFYFHAADELSVDGEAEFDCVDGIEQAFFVFLKVFVVSQRQAFDGGEHCHEVADGASRLAAHEFRYIGVFLLRHHAGAGAVCVVEFYEGKFARAPEDDFFADAAQVDHEDGCCREEFHDVVAVADGVEAVGINCVEVQLVSYVLTVDREGRAGKCACAERHDVAAFVHAFEAGEIALEHGEVRHHVMREQDRLRALEMRVAGHDHVFVFFCGVGKCFLQCFDELCYFDRFAAHVHMRVECYLVVAASCCVQSAAGFADGFSQAFFDVHMNVFEIDGEIEIACFDLGEDVLETADDCFYIVVAQNAHFVEHFGMGDAAGDVFMVHALIEVDRSLKFIDHFVGGFGEPAAPHLFCHYLRPAFSFMIARTLSGRPNRLMKPVPSAWL